MQGTSKSPRTCDGVLGIYDFRYAPYALGDTFTWLVNLQILARQHSTPHIDMMLVTLPERPASRLQLHISRHNYVQVIDGLLPAFLCCKGVRSISIYEQKRKAVSRIWNALKARTPSWPNLFSHFREQLDFFSHKRINAYFAEHGWIPKVTPPPGFAGETEAFKAAFLDGYQPFIVNIRQRGLTDDPQALNRDSPAAVWLGFLETAEKKWPNARFVLVGGFQEWERCIASRPNVVIPRALGLGLGHELTMLLGGMPFMGTSSGFSAAATFSDTPYVITNFEHRAAKYIGIPPGTDRYPFATQQQWLSWEPETVPLLCSHFERLRDSLSQGQGKA